MKNYRFLKNCLNFIYKVYNLHGWFFVLLTNDTVLNFNYDENEGIRWIIKS